MSVIRVGSTSNYADGWSLAFGKAAKPAAKKAKPAKKAKAKAKAKKKRK